MKKRRPSSVLNSMIMMLLWITRIATTWIKNKIVRRRKREGDRERDRKKNQPASNFHRTIIFCCCGAVPWRTFVLHVFVFWIPIQYVHGTESSLPLYTRYFRIVAQHINARGKFTSIPTDNFFLSYYFHLYVLFHRLSIYCHYEHHFPSFDGIIA